MACDKAPLSLGKGFANGQILFCKLFEFFFNFIHAVDLLKGVAQTTSTLAAGA